MKPRERRVTVLRKWAVQEYTSFEIDRTGRRPIANYSEVAITPAGRKALAEAVTVYSYRRAKKG